MNQSHHSAKYYAIRHTAKVLRHWLGSKAPAYIVVRREMRKVYCEYYSCGYHEFSLALDQFKYGVK